MTTYDTLSEAINGLKAQGFTLDYNLKSDCIRCQQSDIDLNPADFDIVEVYRFEGMSNPDDSSVLYAIESKNGERGTLVDAYGAYAEAISLEMAQKLRYTPEV